MEETNKLLEEILKLKDEKAELKRQAEILRGFVAHIAASKPYISGEALGKMAEGFLKEAEPK